MAALAGAVAEAVDVVFILGLAVSSMSVCCQFRRECSVRWGSCCFTALEPGFCSGDKCDRYKLFASGRVFWKALWAALARLVLYRG